MLNQVGTTCCTLKRQGYICIRNERFEAISKYGIIKANRRVRVVGVDINGSLIVKEIN